MTLGRKAPASSHRRPTAGSDEPEDGGAPALGRTHEIPPGRSPTTPPRCCASTQRFSRRSRAACRHPASVGSRDGTHAASAPPVVRGVGPAGRARPSSRSCSREERPVDGGAAAVQLGADPLDAGGVHVALLPSNLGLRRPPWKHPRGRTMPTRPTPSASWLRRPAPSRAEAIALYPRAPAASGTPPRGDAARVQRRGVRRKNDARRLDARAAARHPSALVRARHARVTGRSPEPQPSPIPEGPVSVPGASHGGMELIFDNARRSDPWQRQRPKRTNRAT